MLSYWEILEFRDCEFRVRALILKLTSHVYCIVRSSHQKCSEVFLVPERWSVTDRIFCHYGQIMYRSWDMVRDGCNYFSFWAIFCYFTPQQPKKPKFWKNEKKCLEISSFYICVPKIIIRWCTVPEIWCVADVISSNFRLFFALIPP